MPFINGLIEVVLNMVCYSIVPKLLACILERTGQASMQIKDALVLMLSMCTDSSFVVIVTL